MIQALIRPLLGIWDNLDDLGRRQATLVLLSGVLFLIHFAWFSHWYIEDAAISFAYARFFAEGEGWVPYAGGELVEGFSNPTWTLLLAGEHFIGLNPFIAAKLSGAVLGVLGLPFAWWWARQVMSERTDLAPALVPLLLALSPQYTNWAASGLENSVVTFTMAVGGALLLREIQERRRIPWSALWWSLLAISRPEAVAYAFVAGVSGFIGIVGRRGPAAALDWAWRWLLLASGPFLAWHLYAFATFAWEAPNTYFAKLHDGGRFRPWDWSGKRARGWGYLRGYALMYGHGFFLWIYLLGQSGFKGLRGKLMGVATALIYIIVLPGVVWLWALWGEVPLDGWVPALGSDADVPFWPFSADPRWLATFRILMFVALGFVVPLAGLLRTKQIGRAMCWWLTCFILFFAVYAGGDWMDGFRWFNLCIVPLMILFVDGASQLVDAIRERWGRPRLAWALGGLPLAIAAILGVVHTVNLVRGPETSPYDVHRRVHYMQKVGERLDLRRPGFMDVDMGAHQWWAGPQSEIVDMAGLIDVPMGHHKWQKEFTAEYVYEERRPAFAHIHGSWAGKTGLKRRKGYRDYIGISPFPVSVYKYHIGSHLRRDLLFGSLDEANPARMTVFQTGFALADWQVPAPEVVAGQTLTVKVAWQRLRGLPRGVRPIVFLSGQGRVVTKELPPAYDWVEVRKWKKDEVVRGTHRLTLPEDLPAGDYDIGFVVMSPRGLLQAMERPEGAAKGPPVYARGEVRWLSAVKVVDEPTLSGLLEDRMAQILVEPDCEAREAGWQALRHHRPLAHRWTRRQTPLAEAAIATCYAERLKAQFAAGQPDDVLFATGKHARWWDHRPYAVAGITAEVAAVWRRKSIQAEKEGDLDRAYEYSHRSLVFEPQRAWERRRAEALRDARLGLEPTPSLSERLFEKLGLEGTSSSP
ncbi:MAG: hypothetical protein AB8H79_08970 [Myxococcota bacterium]